MIRVIVAFSFISSLFMIPSFADLGPAETAMKKSSFNAWCGKRKNDCTVSFEGDRLLVNGTDSINKNQILRIWADNLKEMLVEAGLAAWSADDSNNCRKIDIHSKKQLTWYSFRHTWITFALERGVPIAVVCNNCDTSLSYVQDHYFHYDASKATSALETGRKFQARSALTTDWMKDPYTDQTP